MNTKSMRERFEAWYDAFEFRRDYDEYGPSGAAFEVWQAATLAERERAANVCEELANLMESGAGEKEPGHRLRQAARNIRKGE